MMDWTPPPPLACSLTPIHGPTPLQDSSVAGRPTAWRHFAEVPSLRVPQLFVTESHIVLGPTVESTANVQFVLERLLLERQLYGPKVKQSTISYRR